MKPGDLLTPKGCDKIMWPSAELCASGGHAKMGCLCLVLAIEDLADVERVGPGARYLNQQILVVTSTGLIGWLISGPELPSVLG